jgi:trk system potassium uptake protein TrkA
MKILILGAGQVGTSVAANLVSEANDITVVDTDANRLRELADRFDLRTCRAMARTRTCWRAPAPRTRT